jgi:hypothetical protein
MGLSFVLDSAGQNINSKYAGLRVNYIFNDQNESVPYVQLLMTGGIRMADGIREYADPRIFSAMSTIQVSVTKGVSDFHLVFEGKKIASFTLKSHKELFDGKYVIDELRFNGQTLAPLREGTPNTYIFRLN